MRYKRKKGQKTIKSKKISYDGINFASGLERYCYIALKKAKLFEKYEEERFNLIDSFTPSNEFFERQSNGKGEYRGRGGKKILGINYTPDFTGIDYIIECKGRANESFPLRYKLFKLWLMKNQDTRTCYKPQNQKEVDQTIELIKSARGAKRY